MSISPDIVYFIRLCKCLLPRRPPEDWTWTLASLQAWTTEEFDRESFQSTTWCRQLPSIGLQPPTASTKMLSTVHQQICSAIRMQWLWCRSVNFIWLGAWSPRIQRSIHALLWGKRWRNETVARPCYIKMSLIWNYIVNFFRYSAAAVKLQVEFVRRQDNEVRHPTCRLVT